MFGFFKRKTREIKAPVEGEVVALESVEDEVFAQHLVGDGVAIMPVNGTFTAPIDGTITKIFSTNHAYSIKSERGLEVMVHIGLETVSLKGEGFTRIANEGDAVVCGDVVIKADLNYLREHAKSIVTPIVVSEESDVKEIKKILGIVKTSDTVMEVK